MSSIRKNRSETSRIRKELFVISDLHIGGRYGKNRSERGFRINTHIDHLVNFVREIEKRAKRTGLATELVINGDFVDFLAEEVDGEHQWCAFIADPINAVAVFDTILERDRPIFNALKKLVQSGVELTILLGNHDIELCLPAVRERFFAEIKGESAAPFKFIYDGEAHVVGDVLIEHGNRYDGFNVVDHDRLRRYRSVQSRRLPMKASAEFHPPAGSRLVETVMNPIKEVYAFVDLLKPETETVIPFLIALDPGYAADIEKIVTLSRLFMDAHEHQPAAPAWPSHEGDINFGPDLLESGASLEDLLTPFMGEVARKRLMSLVEKYETESRKGEETISLRKGLSHSWSLFRLITAGSWEKRQNVLLDALRVLQHDNSFKRTEESKKYIRHAEKLAEVGFNTVVFGHTHLAKEVELGRGVKYLNTGTWGDLIRIPRQIHSGHEEVAFIHLNQFIEAIKTGQFDDYLKFIPTFAQITLSDQGHTIAAKLRNYQKGEVLDLEPGA